MKKYKVVHNRKKCIGCHSCVEIAPSTWKIDPVDGKSRLHLCKEKGDLFIGEIFEMELAKNESAAKACPMQIIRIEKH